MAATRQILRDEADDVGFLASEPQHAPPGAADEDRRVRLLDRLRGAIESGDRVMGSLKGERLVAPEPLEDRQGLVHAIDAPSWWIEGDTRPLVFLLEPASPETELEPAVAEQIERRRLLRKQCRMPVIIGENDRPDPQCGRDRGGGGERGYRGQGVHEMVGHHQDGVAQRLHAAGFLLPVLARGRFVGKDREPKWPPHGDSPSIISKRSSNGAGAYLTTS